MSKVFAAITLITALSATTVAAAPVQYDFSGAFSWDGLSSVSPTSANASFEGSALLENGLNSLTAASFDSFSGLTVGGTAFDISNVGIQIINTATELRLVIGGQVPGQILGGTDDFSIEFTSSSAVDVNALPNLIEISVSNIFVTNAGVNGIKSPDITGGSIRFNRMASDPNVIPVPAAAALFLAGLAAVGFVSRRRKHRAV